MRPHKLTITIAGPCGSGKTALAAAISNLCSDAKIDSVITEGVTSEAEQAATVRLLREPEYAKRRLRSLSSHKTFVHIITKQTPRNSL